VAWPSVTFSSMGNVTIAWQMLFSLGAPQMQTAEDFRGRVKLNGRNSMRDN